MVSGLSTPAPPSAPFDVNDDEEQHARIPNDDCSRFVLMSGGYQTAADILVKRALEDAAELDTLIYPILFLYRHALELNLKYVINVYGPHVDIDPIWYTHDFRVLWPRFLDVLKGFGTDDPDQADQVVGGVIAQFGNVDPGSFSHRYPADRWGNPIPLAKDRINLKTLKDVMDGVFGYFPGKWGLASSIADHLRDVRPARRSPP